MKVLHVTPYFAPAFGYGGPPRNVLGLCRGLRAAGVEVQVLTTTADGAGELPAEVVARGEYGGVPVEYHPRACPARAFRAPSLRRRLEEVVADYDLVHVHGCWNLTVWGASAVTRRSGTPTVVSPRGMLDPWSFTRGRLRKWAAYRLVERPRFERAAAVHVASALEEERYLRLGISTPVIRVPNGVDVEEFAALPERAAARTRLAFGQEFVVLFLGRVASVKNVELLADAFARLVQSLPAVRLVLAGGAEPAYRRHLEQRFCGLIASGRMQLLGHVDGAARLDVLAAADVLALTSHSENFGLVVAEAMACGLPALVTSRLPWADVASWGVGVQVDATVEGVLEGLRSLATSGGRAAMGARGRALARELFDWGALGRRMSQAYEELLRRGRPPALSWPQPKASTGG